MDQKTKYTTTINPVLDKKNQKLTFHVMEEVPGILYEVFKKHSEEICDFKEETIKKALIKLGWTPPKDNK